MLLCASPRAGAAERGDTLRLTLTDVFTKIETENRTMTMLRSAQEAAEEGIRSAKDAKFPEINAI